MDYGIISENTKINEAIYRCFKLIAEQDEAKFVKDFRMQPHNESQILHTFRELLLGAFLASYNYKVRRDYKIDEKTPDWSILNDNMEVIAIIELINFHIDKNTENEIKKAESSGMWIGWPGSNNDRLWQRIQEKTEKYERIIKKHNLPYVVALFGEFTALVELDEINECLFTDHNGGIFKRYDFLSGFVYFEESAGKYNIKYINNPHVKLPFCLPSGVFL